MTGLSDEQRADFKLMKAVNGVTLGDPKNRVLQLNKFSQRVTSNENIKKELLEWDMVSVLTLFLFENLIPVSMSDRMRE